MIETKQIRMSKELFQDEVGEIFTDYQKEIEDNKAFGWEPTQVITSGTNGRGHSAHHYQIMARDTAMPHYSEFKSYETTYYELKSKRQRYKEMEMENVLLLLALLIVPGIIYIFSKLNQKKEIKQYNLELLRKMDETVTKARKIGD